MSLSIGSNMKLNTKHGLLTGSLIFTACVGMPAHASTIVFDNLNSTTPYYSLAGNTTGAFNSPYSISATTFTPNATGQLDSMELGLYYLLGTNSVTLRLSLDTGGLPGAPIWQTSAPPAAMWGQLMSVTNIGGPTINSGQQYWLEAVAPVTPQTLHSWDANNQNDKGPVIRNGTYYAFVDRFALRVGVLTPGTVPEPASFFLLMCGMFGVALNFRRR
jgi:hypothetical protein